MSLYNDRVRRAKFAADAAGMDDETLRLQTLASMDHPGELRILQNEWNRRQAERVSDRPAVALMVAAQTMFAKFQEWVNGLGWASPPPVVPWDYLSAEDQLAWLGMADDVLSAYDNPRGQRAYGLS